MSDKNPIKLLIIAELDGVISQSDKKYLHNWVSKSEKNKLQYTQIKDSWEISLSNLSQIVDTSKEWERFQNRINTRPKTKKRKLITSVFYKVAAVLIIGLLITNILFQYFETAEPVCYTAIAPKGSISQNILPDGTIIYLNSGTEIKYEEPRSGENLRQVYINGEAWFDVAKNKKRPFIVHTPYYSVKVLGTQFNVKCYEDDETVATTLEEGSIQVLNSEKFKLAENVTLIPGEQILFNKTERTISKRNVDTNIFTSWRKNKLIFLDMTFGELVKLLERKYGVEIEVADKSILKEHYSGTIKNETITEILNIVQNTHPIKYEVKGQKIVIQKR